MSDTMAMEQAASQAGQTAAVALHVLVMAAQALREHQEREAAKATTTTAPAPTPTPAPDPQRDRFAKMVRDTVQPAAVAEAMVTAPQWPQLADELRKLEAAGVDVKSFLGQAAPVIAKIDTDLRAGSPAPGVTVPANAATPRNPWAPPPGQDRPSREGPGLGERIAELVKKAAEAIKNAVQKLTGRNSGGTAQPAVNTQANILAVVTAREALADEKVLGQLVNSREWPDIAEQMKGLQEAGHNAREALAGVPTRIEQAKAAGITLSAAEAAHGLLNEQAATPAPPAAASQAPNTTASPSSTPATEATPTAAPQTSSTTASSATSPAVARTAAANAQSTTATPGATPAPSPAAAQTAPTASPQQTRSHGR